MKNYYKKGSFLLLLIFFSFFFSELVLANSITSKTNNLSAKNPKIANIFLKWEISDKEAEELAKWDLLILDMENQVNNPEKILKIRDLNPDIIILAYISSQEIRSDVHLYDNLSLRKKMFSEIPEDWYLRFDKQKISFWPGTWMLNSSNEAPLVDGQRWNDYLPEFVANEIISSGLWDGIFYDNLFDSISWLNNGQIDLNNNGLADEDEFINNNWRQGNINILKKTRDLISYDFIILANSSSWSEYHRYLNGRVFEDFPDLFKEDGSWIKSINSYNLVYNVNIYPRLYIFNSTENDFHDYEEMRFALASSLLFDDVYFSFDKSVEKHEQLWFYDEYNFDFAYPLSEAIKNEDLGFWQRKFKNFLVVLNPYDYEIQIPWPEGYKKIYSWEKQESEKINLSAQEALFFEPIIDSFAEALRNKEEYNVFNSSGRKVRSFLFISNDDFEEGELIIENDLGEFEKADDRVQQIDSNNNGFIERVEGVLERDRSLVRIFSEDDRLLGIFSAFPDEFKCGVRVAVGDIDGNGQAEIITMPFFGGPHVRIFDFHGNLKYDFFAYNKDLRSYFHLLLSDVNKDGRVEVLINHY